MSNTIAETVLIVDGKTCIIIIISSSFNHYMTTELHPVKFIVTDVHVDLQTIEISWGPLIKLPLPLMVQDIKLMRLIHYQ